MDFLKPNSGQLLLEVLIAIAIAAGVLSLGAGLLFVGLSGNKAAVDKDVALGLSEEAFEAVRAIAFERWNGIGADTPIPGKGIYDLTKNSNYYPTKDSDSAGVSYKWIDHTPGSGNKWSTNTMRDISAFAPNNVWMVGSVAASGTNVWNWDGENWLKF